MVYVMSGKELIPLTDDLPTRRDALAASSSLPRRPQVLILGNVTSGATDLWSAISDEANARGTTPDGIVEIGKYTNNLLGALYGINDRPSKRNHAVPQEEDRQLPEGAGAPQRTSVVAKAMGWLAARKGRRASELEQVAESDTAPVPALPPEERAKTLPQGVIVFPEMRFHDGISPSSVVTPYEKIEAFCVEHGVPLVYVDKADVAGAIGSMLTPPALPPAAES